MNLNEIKDKVRSKGHWRVIIRPAIPFFKSERILVNNLQKSIEDAQVRLRGWYYPHLNGEGAINSGVNKICDSCEFENIYEFWEFTTSGQFGHIFSMREDFLIEPNSKAVQFIKSQQHFGQDKVGNINKFLEVLSLIYRFTEIYRFAANLAQQNEYSDVKEFEIVVELMDVKDRLLYISDARRSGFSIPYICHYENGKITFKNTYSSEDLIAKFDLFAYELIQNTFQAFNWNNAQERMIREDQGKLLERRI